MKPPLAQTSRPRSAPLGKTDIAAAAGPLPNVSDQREALASEDHDDRRLRLALLIRGETRLDD